MSRPHLDVAGISIDCPEPVALARFYLALLGGDLLWENPSSSGIRTHSGLNIVAQRVANYIPPTWPSASIVHFDLDAGVSLDDPSLMQSNVGRQKQRSNRTRGGEFSSTPPATPSASLQRCTKVEAIMRWANPLQWS